MSENANPTWLYAHVPKAPEGRRAKASPGAPAQVRIQAPTDSEARRVFAEYMPERDITASGQLGVG
jgi:hypothetical protein